MNEINSDFQGADDSGYFLASWFRFVLEDLEISVRCYR